VVIKTTFCSGGVCNSAVVVRLDGQHFNDHQRKILKLNSKLVQLTPKTDDELRGALIDKILRKQELREQNQAEQQPQLAQQ
jgi:hypothetical protein